MKICETSPKRRLSASLRGAAAGGLEGICRAEVDSRTAASPRGETIAVQQWQRISWPGSASETARNVNVGERGRWRSYSIKRFEVQFVELWTCVVLWFSVFVARDLMFVMKTSVTHHIFTAILLCHRDRVGSNATVHFSIIPVRHGNLDGTPSLIGSWVTWVPITEKKPDTIINREEREARQPHLENRTGRHPRNWTSSVRKLNQSDWNISNCTSSGQNWEKLKKTGQNWAKLGKTAQNWAKLGKTGRNWAKLGETGWNWKKNSAKLMKTG